MNEPYTIPSLDDLTTAAAKTPAYMRPNLTPLFVVWEGALSDQECDDILEVSMLEEIYTFHNCDATTRECKLPLSPIFDPIVEFTVQTNHVWWEFDVDDTPAAWLQTYSLGDSYKLHTDGFLGQTRKLTTIALLSDPNEYEGGFLKFVAYPLIHTVPRTRGTMCVFPPWLHHEVSILESGIRQTINLGLWGPPFK